MHGFVSYQFFKKARSLRSDRASVRAWSLRSNRASGRPRSLRSDQLVRCGEAGEVARRIFRSRKLDQLQRIVLVLIDVGLQTSIDGLQSKPIDRLSRASNNHTYRVNRILQCREDPDSRGKPKIDVARLNALRPQPKPLDNPLEATSTHSDDAADSMEVDRKPQTSSRRIDDPGLIVACHCGAEYETDYSATIETHTATSIDSAHQKSIDSPKEESVDSSPGDWKNDYYNPTMAAHTRHTMHTEERAIEYKAILDEEDRLLHHSSWKTNAPSINRNVSTSIDTHLHQTRRKRASTDIAYYPSIGINVDCAREGDYSIGSWVDDHHHESYAVETAIHEPGADELHEGFTYEEFLNMQRRDEAVQHQAETCWERTHFNHPCSRINRPSIDDKPPSSIYIRPKPKSTVSEKSKHDKQYLTHDEFGIFRDPDGYARAIDGHALHISRVDIADIL
ncbi:hypothetical protein F2Q68_00015611 [Brassica cretica]|uniref:Uncharacterized protein n=1 Tax=Brassica cretica TaxID=69181 RepID=A0A8S9HQ94_BRACR|nr:hypothetical protein F2Q68_00015611 [Brassica cretica]